MASIKQQKGEDKFLVMAMIQFGAASLAFHPALFSITMECLLSKLVAQAALPMAQYVCAHVLTRASSGLWDAEWYCQLNLFQKAPARNTYQADAGFTSHSVSQAMESEWSALKKFLPAELVRADAPRAMEHVLVAEQALWQHKGWLTRGAVDLRRLRRLPTVCARVVSGLPLCTERLTYRETSSLDFPNARSYIDYLPDNYRRTVLGADEAIGAVRKIYTMSLVLRFARSPHQPRCRCRARRGLRFSARALCS